MTVGSRGIKRLLVCANVVARFRWLAIVMPPLQKYVVDNHEAREANAYDGQQHEHCSRNHAHEDT